MLEVCSGIVLFSGVRVIRSVSGVKSVLYLIGVYIGVACMLIRMGLSYIGIILVILYVGAVSVLFLFIVMLVGDRKEEKIGKAELALSVVLSVLWGNTMVKRVKGSSVCLEYSGLIDKVENVKGIGEVMFTERIYEVLVIGLVLLVAMIGGVSLVLKSRPSGA